MRKLTLGHLHVHNGDAVSDEGKKLPGAVGLYRTGRIDLALSRSLGAASDEITPGSFTATRGTAGALAHELGHHVEKTVLTRAAQAAWTGLWRQYSGSGAALFRAVSAYAASSPEEAFAESFAVYTHARYAGQLPRPISAFMDQHVAKRKKKESD